MSIIGISLTNGINSVSPISLPSSHNSSSPSISPLKVGLVSYYTFNNRDITEALKDNFGSNDLTYTSPVDTVDIGLQVDGGIKIYDTGVVNGNLAGINLNGGDLTILMWIAPSSDIGTTFSLGEYGLNPNFKIFGRQQLIRYKMKFTWSSEGYIGVKDTNTNMLGGFIFVAVTYGDGLVKIHRRSSGGSGVEYFEDSTPLILNTDTLVLSNNGATYFDELGFWNRALSVDEIDWIYNSGSGRAYSDFDTYK